MTAFDSRAYGPIFEDLLSIDGCRDLGPGTPNGSVESSLSALSLEGGFAHTTVVDHEMARLCCSAVWLWHNYLDESHTISQDVPTSSGSYWHGIMHRREPDYPNSKYWFRRVGSHPVFERLRQGAGNLAETYDTDSTRFLGNQPTWDPFRFVDLCETAHSTGFKADLCVQIQMREWQLLFDHCYGHAVGAK